MSQGTKISWSTATWNPWLGCTKCAPECHHCYIEFPNMGFGNRDPWADIYISQTWRDPVIWERQLADTNYAKRTFTCSLSDFFHAKVDNRRLHGEHEMVNMPSIAAGPNGLLNQLWRDAAWRVIKNTPHVLYQILTKRPERIINHLPKDWPYPNVWLGTSTGCNKTLSKLDSLRKVPIHPEAVRFVSVEPLLEDGSQKINLDGIGWLITGGESGLGEEYLYNPAVKDNNETGRRTMKLDWARKLQRLCYRQGVKFYFKQLTGQRSGEGEDALGTEDTHEYPDPPKGLIWMPEPKLETLRVIQ